MTSLSTSTKDGAAASGRKRHGRWIVVFVGMLALLVIVPLVSWWALVALEARAARRALAAGRYEEAEAAINRWLRLALEPSEPLLVRTRVALARDRVEEAVAVFATIKAKRSEGSETELVGAIIGARGGYNKAAEPILSRAFQERRGPDPQLDEALAKVYLENYEFSRALVVIDRWKRDAPESAKPYLWKTEIDRRVKDRGAELIGDFREALRRDPNLAKARIGLADQLRAAHLNAEAAAEYRAYIALKPNDPVGHMSAGLVAIEVGDLDAATLDLDRALALDPSNAQVLKERAEVELRRGKFEKALPYLDRAVALDPFDVSIRYSRGTVFGRLGKSAEARAEQAAANRLRIDNDRLTTLQYRLIHAPNDIGLQLQMARWLLDHGHASEGIRWCEKVIEQSPDNPEACRILADYYAAHGNPGLANFYRLHASPTPASP